MVKHGHVRNETHLSDYQRRILRCNWNEGNKSEHPPKCVNTHTRTSNKNMAGIIKSID